MDRSRDVPDGEPGPGPHQIGNLTGFPPRMATPTWLNATRKDGLTGPASRSERRPR